MQQKYSFLFQKIWVIILWIILIYSTQHLIRDILSDIFGIHNIFTEFGHRESSNVSWCGEYCKWTTFSIEIFYIFSSIYLIKKREFGKLGWIMIVLIIPVLLQYFGITIK